MYSSRIKYITNFYPWIVWCSGAFFYCYQFILRVSPGAMAEDLMQAFVVQGCSLGILGAFYYKAYSVLQLPIGIIMDRIGPMRILALSCFLCALGTILFASAQTLLMASLGRFIIGMGSAGAFVGTIKLATLWFPQNMMGRIIGLTMLLGYLGGTLGGTPLVILVEYVGWRSALVIISGMGFLWAMVIWSLIKGPKAPYELEDFDFSNKNIFQGVLSLFSRPKVWFAALYGMLMYVPLAVFEDLWGIPFIMKLYEVEKPVAASVVSMLLVGVAIGGPIIAFLSDYWKNRWSFMFFGALISFILYSIIVYMPNIPLSMMYILLFLAGLSFTTQLLCFPTVCSLVPVSSSGVALGFTNMVVMASGVIFEPIIGWLLDYTWSGAFVNNVPDYSVNGWRVALSTIPVSLCVAVILMRFIEDTYPRRLQQSTV
jgi:MFS family permease